MTNFEKRRQNIFLKIKENKKVTIDELVSQFNVNEPTIYKDLLYLEKENKIRRTTGGAIYYSNFENAKDKFTQLKLSNTDNIEEKKTISNFASTLIKDGESLMIDGGTTTLLFASSLSLKKKLMIITNAMPVGHQLKNNKKNTVIMTGGQLYDKSSATTGVIAQNAIKGFKVNKAVIGINAISSEKGFFATIKSEARIKQAMINSAKEIIILADSSKFSNEGINIVCEFDKKITLVTDKGISKTDLDNLRKNNITVYVT